VQVFACRPGSRERSVGSLMPTKRLLTAALALVLLTAGCGNSTIGAASPASSDSAASLSPAASAEQSPTPASPQFSVPKNQYGITWANITDRIDDISAAAWTDARLTIESNNELPSATDVFISYITPGARSVDPKIDEANIILKRVFQLYARYPSPSRVFFIALTRDDRVATEKWLSGQFPGSDFIANSIDSIYQTHPQVEGVVTWSNCAGRNTYTLYKGRSASAVILGVCPSENGQDQHFDGVWGMAHEYMHTLGLAFNPQFPSDINHVLPCWFTEGQPEWTQAAVSNKFNTYLRAQHLHPYYLTQSGLGLEQTVARKWSQAKVESYLRAASDVRSCWQTSQYALAYSLGAVAVEALVSISGSESVVAFHQKLMLGMTFDQAFSDVYGIPWEQAVPVLAKVVAVKITRSWAANALTYQTRPSP